MLTVAVLLDGVGVYGDVTRVKIMFNKKDNALVQYTDPGQARVGKSNSGPIILMHSVLSII